MLAGGAGGGGRDDHRQAFRLFHPHARRCAHRHPHRLGRVKPLRRCPSGHGRLGCSGPPDAQRRPPGRKRGGHTLYRDRRGRPALCRTSSTERRAVRIGGMSRVWRRTGHSMSAAVPPRREPRLLPGPGKLPSGVRRDLARTGRRPEGGREPGLRLGRPSRITHRKNVTINGWERGAAPSCGCAAIHPREIWTAEEGGVRTTGPAPSGRGP
ncbi:hypothetical protein SAMN04490244_104376 [Tranquillimonas rosea]|uniref:Uncharacterized protein n=1 Tax=Tranquillimonas rosea TaxID=641238 RepID=A0A1H9TU55_9RHOB|nr:hypothetical protein SAMN04490244_104376 [Tranquillimonas rosea]